jgi:hypothetical protein
MYDLDGGRHGSDDGLICDAYPDGDGADGTSIAVVAGTTDHSALPSSTGVSTKLRANTRALEDDGARSSVTEIGGAQSISVEDSSDIVRSGPRADLLLRRIPGNKGRLNKDEYGHQSYVGRASHYDRP